MNLGVHRDVIVLVLVWCLCTRSVSCDNVRLHGAGASFPNEIYQSWIINFKAYREEHVSLDMAYSAVGSSAGKRRIKGEEPEAESIEYAGSDSLLLQTDYEAFPDLKMFPTMAGAVAVGYNLPFIDRKLVLSLPILAEIYNASIRWWNDSKIQLLNPNMSLPHAGIIVLARSDKSGTTNIFTGALSKVDWWSTNYGTFSDGEANRKWATDAVTYFAHQNRGMSGLILSFPYSVGYLSIADAIDADVDYARLKNRHGTVVDPDIASVQDSMNKAAESISDGDLTMTLSEYEDTDSYPIAGFTYLIVFMATMKHCDTAVELVRYIEWFTTADSAMSTCTTNGMTPLSEKLAHIVNEQITQQITCNGKSSWNAAEHQKVLEKAGTNQPLLIGTTVGSMLLLFGLAIGLLFLIKWVRYHKRLSRNEWLIEVEDILFYQTATTRPETEADVTNWPSVAAFTDVENIDGGIQLLENILHWPGKWGANTIGLRLLELKLQTAMNKNTKIMFLWMRELHHNNVLSFHGLACVENSTYIVNEYCTKGCLLDLIRSDKLSMKTDMKFSLSLDIIKGLSFLHSKSIIHGHLRSSLCLLDYKWTVKIADWEFCKIYKHTEKGKSPLCHVFKTVDEVGNNEAAIQYYWTAPEILRDSFSTMPTHSCDIYSYSVIIQEIFSQKTPYHEVSDMLAPSELIKAITNNNLRPQISDVTPNSIRDIMESAWADDPSVRPSSDAIVDMLHQAHKFKRTVIDAMMEATEEYTRQLEHTLTDTRTRLAESRDYVESFLNKTIPTDLLEHAQRNIADAPSELNMSKRIKASIVCVKYDVDIPECQMWTLYNNLDLLLDNMLSQYSNHYRFHVATGLFGIIFTDDGKSKNGHRHFMQAVASALELQRVQTELNGHEKKQSKQFLFKIGLHVGTVCLCVISNSIPRCLVLGSAVDHVKVLACACVPGKILVSRAMADCLSPWTTDKYVLDPCNEQQIKKKAAADKLYWLSPRPMMMIRRNGNSVAIIV